MKRLSPTDTDAYRFSIRACREVLNEIVTNRIHFAIRLSRHTIGRFRKLHKQFQDAKNINPDKLPALFRRLTNAIESLKRSREHVLPRKYRHFERGNHNHSHSQGHWNLIPTCSRCNEAKGGASFPVYLEKLARVNSRRTDIKLLEHLGRHFEWRFNNLHSMGGEHPKAMRRLLGNIGHMAVTGENSEVFPPSPEQVARLYLTVSQASSFRRLFENSAFQHEVGKYIHDPAVGSITTNLLREIKALRVA